MTGPPRLLILGASGMLGRTATRLLAAEFDVAAPAEAETDITSDGDMRSALAHYKPAVVLNCAAYTAVDDCETRRELAFVINGDAPGIVARACRDNGSLLVHLSTDYVFDGTGVRPYDEEASTGPINVYGESKLAGERAVIESGADYLIARTAWLYGLHGRHFIRTIYGRLKERAPLTVVNDQHGSPTSAVELCWQLAALLRSDCRGIYHTVSCGSCSWYDLALKIAELAGANSAITPCGSDRYPRPAARPANSRLSTQKLVRDTGYQPRSWETVLYEYMEEEAWLQSL